MPNTSALQVPPVPGRARPPAQVSPGQEGADTARGCLNALPTALVQLDAEARVVAWNRGAERLFGIACQHAVGVSLAELAVPWDADLVLPCVQTCLERGRDHHLSEVHFSRGDGDRGILEVTVTRLLDREALGRGCVVLGTDVTERRVLEGQLAQSQKLESIGQLAAGIAHEINTPIQYIGDNIRFLQDAYAELAALLRRYEALAMAARGGQPTEECFEAVERQTQHMDLAYLQQEIPVAIQQSLEGVERVGSIVQAMKLFAHPGTDDKVPTDINAAIESTVNVSRNNWKYVAEMVLDLHPRLPLVPSIPGEFNQAVLNIIINAVHAIEEARSRGHRPGPDTITITTRAQDGWAEIRIADTGTGIPKAARSRIFDPFFTTKEVGRGTGQGLSLTREFIVVRHGGTLSFETREGEGTTFIIRLPLSGDAG